MLGRKGSVCLIIYMFIKKIRQLKVVNLGFLPLKCIYELLVFSTVDSSLWKLNAAYSFGSPSYLTSECGDLRSKPSPKTSFPSCFSETLS